jgi:ABC-type dipeptide/oligopeptide/nickel transport system ATPase component
VSMRSRQVLIATAGATMAVVLGISGCGKSTTTSSSSTASKPPTPIDNTKLLVNPADIVLPGQTFTTAKAPQGFPTGAAVAYVNGDQSLVIDDRIIIAPDAATAEKAFEAGKAKIATALPGTTMTDVSVGQGAAMGVATWKNGTKLANTVTFHEGTAVATMEFDSPVNAPFPEGFPVAIAQKQDAAIKSGLPG